MATLSYLMERVDEVLTQSNIKQIIKPMIINNENYIVSLILTLFVFIGFYIVISFVYQFLHGIYARCIRSGKNLKKIYGKWAIITGATDGIGYGMAKAFAKRGLNVLLISRNKEKLEICQKEILSKYPLIKCDVLDIDFQVFDINAREKVNNKIKELDSSVGILVNNVGISYPYTKYFHELENQDIQQIMTLNIWSTTWMTRLVLPYMIDAKKGAIVNISSAAGVSTSPLLAQYGAAKSYVAMLSKALNAELVDKNIHVQCQIPMFVTTKLAKIKKPSLFVATPSAYAESALNAIGYETIVSPYWSHAFQIWALLNLPEWIMVAVTKNMHMDIRRRGMAKDRAAAASSANDTDKTK